MLKASHLTIPALLCLLSACGGEDASSQAPVEQTPTPTPITTVPTPTPTPVGTCSGGVATTWATACNTPPAACVDGAWSVLEVGSMPAVQHQTAHFALRWSGTVVTAAQAQQAGLMLEKIWETYLGKVGFRPPYCDTAAKYKVNIHVDPTFGLTGGVTGVRDMGMWVGPGALADRWGLAHEFAHALQGSSMGLRDSPYVGWMWESHANWMAHQLDEHRGETHCSVMLDDYPHLHYGSTRDRYCNWQFWEYLKDKYCYAAVNDIWSRSKKPGEEGLLQEDPFSVLARNTGWSANQLNDLLGEWAMHNVHWDYRNLDGSDQGVVYRAKYNDAPPYAAGDRELRYTRLEPLDAARRRYAVPTAWAPQRWGYNVVRLRPDAGAQEVTVTFRGVVQAAPVATSFGGLKNDPASVPNPDSDWRWGVVAVDANGRARHSALQRGADGELRFCLQSGDQSLWLVVMGTPTTIHKIQWDQSYYSIYRYPWMVQLQGAQPDGFQPNAPQPSPAGRRHANGGGWVADGASVAATAYVGPYARVLSGTVSGNARIEDQAVVLSGTVSGNAVVGGLTVLTGGTVIKDFARVATAFKGPGAFETGITLSGTAQILGDVEIRGVSLAKGVFYGLIDAGMVNDAAFGAARTAPPVEVTAPGPYVWRP